MPSRLIYILIVFFPVLIYGLFEASLQLTPRQFFALSWAITLALALYTVDRLGLLARESWSITHLYEQQPPAQVAFDKLNDRLDDSECSLSGLIDNWVGRVETAILASSQEGIYIRVQVGPNAILTNAQELYSGILPRTTLSERVRDGSIVSGDDVLVSGRVSNPGQLCETSLARDGIPTLLLEPTRIERISGFIIRDWMVLGLAWLILVLPSLPFVDWSNRRPKPAQSGPPMKKGLGAAPLKEVRPGVAGVDVMALIAACRQLIKDGEGEAAAKTANEIESAQLASHDEWRTVCALFRSMKRPMSERIVCERYLLDRPAEPEVQLRYAQLLRETDPDTKKPLALAGQLRDRTDLTDAQRLELGALFSALKDRPAAIEVYRTLLDQSPNHLEGHSRLLALLIDMPNPAEAERGLKAFRAMIPDVEHWYVTCAGYAARLGNAAIFQDCADQLRPRVQKMDVYWNRRLVDAYHRMGRREAAEQVYIDVDYAAITSDAVCSRLLTVTEFYGFTRAARLACRRLVELAPTKALQEKLANLELLGRDEVKLKPV